MSQIIIIEENQGLLSVLSNGLKKFANIEPFPRDDAEDAINLLKIIPGISLIITKNKIGNEETAKDLWEYIKKNNLPTKLVVNGPVNENLDASHFVVHTEGDYEQILFNSFKVLNIPMAEISKKNITNYNPVRTSLFKYLDFIPADTFLKLKKPDGSIYYLRCYHQGDNDKVSSIESYLSQGVVNFYIHEEDEIPFHNVLSDSFSKILENQNIPLKKRLDTMADSFDTFSPLAVKWGLISCLVQMYEDLILSAKIILEMHHFIPTVYEQIEKEKYSYNFKNFMNLSGAFFVLGRRNFAELFKEVDKLMGVALFHDIRLKDHQGMILSLRELREAKLSNIEEEIILDHARDAAEILQGEKDFPMDMSKIIREHHGDISGLGFPIPPKEAVGQLSKVFFATELFLKELYVTKDTPDMEKLQKSVKEDIHKQVINQLYLIFSGGK
jgi:hypothetical protein